MSAQVAGPGPMTHYGAPRVLLLRHPCAALVAEYRRRAYALDVTFKRIDPGAAKTANSGQTYFKDIDPAEAVCRVAISHWHFN